jgi:D-alanine-D-alanine ligase
MEDTAEFDKQETVDAIEAALIKMGFKTEQIGNCFQVIEALAAGKKWDLVFNIAEGLYGDGRESVIPAILDQYKIPYVFSGPVILGISLNKHLTRLIVSAAGVPVSPGMLISEPKDVEKCNLKYPLFIKPVSEGTGKGITEKSLVNSPAELKEMAEYLLKRFDQPALAEEYLPGREFTIGVVGSGDDAVAIGGMEIECKDNLPYSVEFKENYQNTVNILRWHEDSPESVKPGLDVWKALAALTAEGRCKRTGTAGCASWRLIRWQAFILFIPIFLFFQG